MGGDGLGAGHPGGFAGGEGAVEVKDLGPVLFKGGVDFGDVFVRKFVEGGLGLFGEGDEFADGVVGVAEGDAFLDEVIDEVGGEEHGVGDRGGATLGDGFDAGETGGEDVEDEAGLVGGVEDGGFVFLQVAVVSEGEPLDEGDEGLMVAVETGGLAPDELKGVGVFLLGHEAGAGGESVRELHEAELATAPKDHVLGEAGKVEADGVAGGGEIEGGVAVADGVHTVTAEAGFALEVGKAEFAGDGVAVDGQG